MLLLLPILLAAAQTTPSTSILDHAHARHDQEGTRPLVAALESGYTSIGVDVHLIEGELRVGEEPEDCFPGRTLQSLYLNPLRQRVVELGRVYEGGPRTIQLVLDIRSRSVPTWRALRRALDDYPDLFTSFGPEGRFDGAVLAIVTGRVPVDEVLATQRRRCALEGVFRDLELGRSAADVPLLRIDWRRLLRSNGQAPLNPGQRQKLEAAVDRAHRRGCRIRVTDVPATERAWTELVRAGVDWLEIEDTQAGAAFFLERGGRDGALRADVDKWLQFGDRLLPAEQLAERIERAGTPPARVAGWLGGPSRPPLTVRALSNGEWVQWLRADGLPSTVEAHVRQDLREIVIDPGRATSIEIALRPDLIDLSGPLTVRIGDVEHRVEPAPVDVRTLLRTRKDLGRCYWRLWSTTL
ncbi:MAG: hypothetical protein AAGB93_01125 [Planctomycetota bacterium]